MTTHHRRLVRPVSILLALCLLVATPAAALASKGQKNYKRGLEHEASQQWEKAAEEFALAVAAEPANPEYQLHYRRAIFNASQLFMQQGAALLERGDFLAAYNAFRRAQGYDPANELARSMMERAHRLQLEKNDATKSAFGPSETAATPAPNGDARATLQDELHRPFQKASLNRGGKAEETSLAAARVEQLNAITYSGDLEDFVKYLARQLRLNVVFDRDFPKRNVKVDLQEVTAAQALDYIFLTQGLFFQKLSNRTILVADQVKRPQYQQLVLRTFYLYNVEPNEARQLIQASIPPQAGRQPVITANKSTNSITVRDTPENVRLVGELLRSIDKERAEVVMDVNIYEVSRADLMQFGNQMGSGDSLLNLGGITKGLSILGGSREVVTQGAGAIAAPTALGAALIVPATALSALQRKDQTRLVASTQVHAFDGEKSTAHIGQRVPVQTASVTPYGSVSTGESDKQPGVTQGLFGGNGYPVIQYEKTGLTLEFTPQVFPNLDVQVKMSIKSNDVSGTAGAALTPTFTERNIEGTARIQNNRTMMIASVAQNSQTRGRQGLPVLGLVPVLGRLFTAPRRGDSQTDIVIAVTPHVLRAPTYTPEDEEMHPSGTLQTPTTGTLEAMLQDVAREEQLAAARAIPTHNVVQLPDAEAPDFVPAPKALMNSVAAPADARLSTREAVYEASRDATQKAQPAAPPTAPLSSPSPSPTPAAQSGEAFVVSEQETVAAAPRPARAVTPAVSKVSANTPSVKEGVKTGEGARANVGGRGAVLMLLNEPREMRVGERRRLRLVLKTDAPLGLVAATLRFDPRVVAVREVSKGTLASAAGANARHAVTPEGLLLLSVAPAAGAPSRLAGAGVVLVIEVEALEAGQAGFSLDASDAHAMAAEGQRVSLQLITDQVSVGR